MHSMFFPLCKGYYEEVYNNLYALACYFDNSEDKWVRNHFYGRCFNIAQRVKADGGKKEAEAHAHMGLLFEEEGEWALSGGVGVGGILRPKPWRKLRKGPEGEEAEIAVKKQNGVANRVSFVVL